MMFTRQSIVILVAVVLGPTARADDGAKAEFDRLQGHWKGVALESDGRKATEAEIEAMKDGGWSFEGDVVSFEDPRIPPIRSRVELDLATDPRSLDLIGLDGPQEGKVMRGIYKIEGDRLTICLRDLASDSKGRPSEFATAPESGLGLIVLERADPE
ncbi:TIGR03067 domain-containing protein [Tautonia plasticadhaerens]|uniref:TIGR03067 domain-containing protein n=1 Tax=Tautonia plasticadhaerens TaxID=2527974 RepID=A0A518H0A9_9BACT|nr:TIGR03067 domain-containing protein [Tautonia plasticadhaerens]QDV34241.1 hypothetical protein ElP_21260 [Tautonia plasticadhaerens]